MDSDRITQLLPGDGWQAVFRTGEQDLRGYPLVAWALTEARLRAVIAHAGGVELVDETNPAFHGYADAASVLNGRVRVRVEPPLAAD